MAEAWIAEHEVGEALARALIEEQFPELAGAAITPLGAGWDNVAYLVGSAPPGASGARGERSEHRGEAGLDSRRPVVESSACGERSEHRGEVGLGPAGTPWVFRFPRRAVAVPLIEAEVRALPLVASRVRVAVPEPRYLGRPSAKFPAPFAGYRWIPGEMVTRLAFDVATRRALASQLAELLRALHAIDPAEAFAVGLGGDTIGRLDVAKQLGKARPRLSKLPADAGDVANLLESSAAAAGTHAAQPALVHGDLHARQILVDHAGRLSGVIDWGDVHVGDPAVDLAAVWSVLPKELHAEFFETYGAIEAATWARARFRAVCHAIASFVHALDVKDAGSEASALQALRWLF